MRCSTSSGDQSIFTKIVLKTTFHLIRVKPEHVEKAAFQVKYGQYQYLVLPMGPCDAPATFTTMMNDVWFCTVYLDDILIFSMLELSFVIHENLRE